MNRIQLKLKHLPSNEADQVLTQSERVHIHHQIETMMQKESSVYKCNDYVLSHDTRRTKKLEKSNILSSYKPVQDQDFIVDDICRQKMCEWSYRIVDHFNGDRKLVAIAQNFVDRFLDQYKW